MKEFCAAVKHCHSFVSENIIAAVGDRLLYL
jgi:hypothetical protein